MWAVFCVRPVSQDSGLAHLCCCDSSRLLCAAIKTSDFTASRSNSPTNQPALYAPSTMNTPPPEDERSDQVATLSRRVHQQEKEIKVLEHKLAEQKYRYKMLQANVFKERAIQVESINKLAKIAKRTEKWPLENLELSDSAEEASADSVATNSDGEEPQRRRRCRRRHVAHKIVTWRKPVRMNKDWAAIAAKEDEAEPKDLAGDVKTAETKYDSGEEAATAAATKRQLDEE